MDAALTTAKHNEAAPCRARSLGCHSACCCSNPTSIHVAHILSDVLSDVRDADNGAAVAHANGAADDAKAYTQAHAGAERHAWEPDGHAGPRANAEADAGTLPAVSYTHLTLPTILLV